MANVLSMISGGLDGRGELVGDGSTRHGNKGYFFKPTVMANRDRADLRIAREDIFGAVIAAIPFDNVDEVTSLMNNSVYGLAACMFTSDLVNGKRAAKSIRAGNA